jgi:DNA-binding XRE family transcriptional regulator
MPKKSGLINGEEVEICRRFRQLRAMSGWSQTDFGKALRVTRDQIANVELERNPLQFSLGDSACSKLDICQQWLATGREPLRGYIELPSETGVEIGLRELFSTVYRRVLSTHVSVVLRETEIRKARAFAQADAAAEQDADNYAYELARGFFSLVPPALRREFFGELSAAASAFLQRRWKKIGRLKAIKKETV